MPTDGLCPSRNLSKGQRVIRLVDCSTGEPFEGERIGPETDGGRVSELLIIDQRAFFGRGDWIDWKFAVWLWFEAFHSSRCVDRFVIYPISSWRNRISKVNISLNFDISKNIRRIFGNLESLQNVRDVQKLARHCNDGLWNSCKFRNFLEPWTRLRELLQSDTKSTRCLKI